MTSTAGDIVTTGFVSVVVGGIVLGFPAFSLRGRGLAGERGESASRASVIARCPQRRSRHERLTGAAVGPVLGGFVEPEMT